MSGNVSSCGYGGTGHLNETFPENSAHTRMGDFVGWSVCFSDIWWWTEVVGENSGAANRSSFYVVCDTIDAAFVKSLEEPSQIPL